MTKTTQELARIRWHCRRGMLELDVLLQTFFDKEYLQLDPADQLRFEHLLTANDQDLYEWLMGKKTPEDKDILLIVKKIIATRMD